MNGKEILDGYIKVVASPEGKTCEWESQPKLIRRIIELADLKSDSRVFGYRCRLGCFSTSNCSSNR